VKKIRVTLLFDAIENGTEVDRQRFGAVLPDKATPEDIGSVAAQVANTIALQMPKFLEDNK